MMKKGMKTRLVRDVLIGSFPKGFMECHPPKGTSGGVLYTKGTEVTVERHEKRRVVSGEELRGDGDVLVRVPNGNMMWFRLESLAVPS